MDPAAAYIEAIAKKYRSRSLDAFDATPVQRAYEDKTLFVTGGFGFLGKHLIYTLFRTCKLKKVYLLLRPKKGKSVHERFENLIKESMFDSIKAKHPDFASKLILIEGDVKELKLGISSNDWRDLTEEVEIIIHGAATINFDEPIQRATLINVRGTREVIRLARDCSKLRALVHISTAYSQATKDRIDREVCEEYYPTPITPETLIHLAETLDGEVLEEVVRPLRSKWPNTYTFTKAVAEDLLREAQDLPLTIVRPAIVINAYREPEPGWLDPSNVFGPSGLVVGAALGVIHVIYMSDDASIDMVPVDYVSNAVVTAGHAAMEGTGGIYNIVTTPHRALWGEKNTYLYHAKEKFPTPKAVWYSFMISTERRWLYLFLFYLIHVIPAYAVDAVLSCVGKPPMFKKVAKKVLKLSNVLSFFTTNTWDFDEKNTLSLYNSLTENDKELFYFDISTVNWEEQIFSWGMGVRKHLIKDDLKDTVYARKKQFWLRIVHYIFSVVYLYMFWLILKWFVHIILLCFCVFVRH